MVQSHILSVPLAVKYGSNESLFLSNICWWMEKNRANKRHFHEGRYWTYNSVTGFAELFPYFTVHQIQHLISKLREKNVLLVGNFNKIGYDRTNWYSVNDEAMDIYLAKMAPSGESGRPEDTPGRAPDVPPPPPEDGPPPEQGPPILPNGKMHFGNFPNAFSQKVKSIPEISQIDHGNFPNPFGKFPEPIPAVKPVVKPVAAAARAKPDKSQAPPPETAAAALQKLFVKIDPALVFSGEFYPRAAAFLQSRSLDENYPAWLYGECLSKNPASLRGLYYRLFFEPDMPALFLQTRKKERDPPPETVITCPVCGKEHGERKDCPECGLPAEDRADGEAVAKQKRLYALSPEEKMAYETELHKALAAFGKGSLGVNPRDMRELLEKKYGLAETEGASRNQPVPGG